MPQLEDSSNAFRFNALVGKQCARANRQHSGLGRDTVVQVLEDAGRVSESCPNTKVVSSIQLLISTIVGNALQTTACYMVAERTIHRLVSDSLNIDDVATKMIDYPTFTAPVSNFTMDEVGKNFLENIKIKNGLIGWLRKLMKRILSRTMGSSQWTWTQIGPWAPRRIYPMTRKAVKSRTVRPYLRMSQISTTIKSVAESEENGPSKPPTPILLNTFGA